MGSLRGNLLYIWQDGWALLFDQQSLVNINLKSGQKDLVLSVRPSGLRGFLSHFRLVTRLLRLEPRCVALLDNRRLVICHAKTVCVLDINNKTFSVVKEAREGFSNTLNFCSDGTYVYWGDYGDNPNREVVNIYRLSKTLNIEIVYSFPKGEIRHIHNIVWDKVHDQFFVLTGDLESSSGIYIASADWEEVTPVVTGLQQYRAVVAFPYGDGLIYATDSVVDKNRIYLLHDGVVEPLVDFPGSCIYGTETKGHYVFASTVEPPEGRGLFGLFTNKLGRGIQDRYAHLITVRKSDLHVEEIFKTQKDMWPMKLFQYGALMFPKVQEKSNDLWYYVMACKGDGHTYSVKL